MADRFFPNQMPDYFPETPSVESAAAAASDSLAKLLYIPYRTLSEGLKKAALDLKDTAYQVTGDKNDLALCSDIIEACTLRPELWFKLVVVCSLKALPFAAMVCLEEFRLRNGCLDANVRRVTFICGQAGVCALGAVVAHYKGDQQLCHRYLSQFKEIKLSKDLPDELLYGRAGFLWASSFLNKNIGKDTISSTRMRAVVDEIIKSGRRLAKGRCPLMFEWHGKKYWGAAHGLAGIMHVLMDMELKPDEVEHVKGTLRYMIKNRFPSGNYPSSEGSETDRLVHWCHGAPGVALTLAKAAKVFGSEEFLQAAIDAGEVVWNRGLLKRVGVCHGISGNAYVFLSLYQLTGKPEFLYRAKAFACFLYNRAQILISEGIMHGGDRPYSLFEGIGGMAYLFLDMTEPSEARFPAYV
ncbi:UNVERIFIED_CONTAM: LanC-like protein GCR2 [Sesamum radiatum]|uniref:LanC-like protein GCR2 n=1 Tax=Sesamum radiatum TaxID=300843 RepID=A0AAW2LNC9_SESRA